jgi:hypothetical protein
MPKSLAVGDKVYFDGPMRGASQTQYTIMRVMPVENDDRRRYRIKSTAETFERVANEDQLTRSR